MNCVMIFLQFHLSGQSYLLPVHCHHQDVAIQPPWLRRGCSFMEEEVISENKTNFLFSSKRLYSTVSYLKRNIKTRG